MLIIKGQQVSYAVWRACMYIVDTYAYCRVCVCVLSVGVRVCVKCRGEGVCEV